MAKDIYLSRFSQNILLRKVLCRFEMLSNNGWEYFKHQMREDDLIIFQCNAFLIHQLPAARGGFFYQSLAYCSSRVLNRVMALTRWQDKNKTFHRRYLRSHFKHTGKLPALGFPFIEFSLSIFFVLSIFFLLQLKSKTKHNSFVIKSKFYEHKGKKYLKGGGDVCCCLPDKTFEKIVIKFFSLFPWNMISRIRCRTQMKEFFTKQCWNKGKLLWIKMWIVSMTSTKKKSSKLEHSKSHENLCHEIPILNQRIYLHWFPLRNI